MNICEPCKQFESLANQWNYTHGFTDPLPYIGEMIKKHKHLFFEERRSDFRPDNVGNYGKPPSALTKTKSLKPYWN